MPQRVEGQLGKLAKGDLDQRVVGAPDGDHGQEEKVEARHTESSQLGS